MSEIEQFRQLYERHVGYVVSGDVKAALSEMVQENLPTVFDGVDVPRANVQRFDIQDVRAEGEFMIGETIYDVGDRRIGLRSIWERHDGEWLAAKLQNFAVPESTS